MSGSNAGAPRSGLCFAAQRRGAKVTESKRCHRDRNSEAHITRTSCISCAAGPVAVYCLRDPIDSELSGDRCRVCPRVQQSARDHQHRR